jgi:Xaa-Pro dipeptidase
VIGEWARDKLIRYCLLTGTGEPWVWDFGSAARHHKLYCPWLREDHVRAGNPGMRGAIGPKVGLFEQAAREIKDILVQEGVARMPLGLDVCEPPMLFALQEQGIDVRDGQQLMMRAREVKSHDEITLLNTAASMVDGVYQDITEALEARREGKPDRRPRLEAALRDGLGLRRGVNAIAGERCSPHPHNFTDRLIRPGDQAYFDIIHSFIGYRTCYYRTFSVGRATPAQKDAYKKARSWMDGAISMLKPGISTEKVAKMFPKCHRDRLRDRDGRLRPEFLPRPGARAARAAADLAPEFVHRALRAEGRHGVRGGDLLPRQGRHLGGAHRGRGGAHAGGGENHLPLSGAGIARCQCLLRKRT